MAPPAFALALLLAGTWPSAEAGGFLGQSMDREVVENMLLAEMPDIGANGQRLAALEEALAPMYASLPKNSRGRLEPATVRYVLHRYFVQTYGWKVKGLDPSGEGWNSSSPNDVMKNRVPAFVQGLFEEQLQGHGMDIQDLAIFTATVADLIERDAALGLEQIYNVLGLSTSGSVRTEALDSAIRAFIASFILGADYPVNSRADVKTNELELQEMYPDWDLTTMWAVDFRRTLDLRAQPRLNPFVNQEGVGFDGAISTVQGIMHNVAALAKYECPSLKAKLLELEVGGAGRVRLSDFYGSGVVPIVESPDYLRNLGVLDDTDPSMPMLIIPNFMVSQSNCIAETGFYESCCLDECEGLLGHLERVLAAPSAAPEHIADLVASLPSDTVDAPRNLSSSLLLRLSEIAQFHNGLVPLHGRLFMQWMHHAYPRECPWPLVSGTSKPLSMEAWLDWAGRDEIRATEEERERYTSAASRYRRVESADTIGVESIPWIVVEELVAKHQTMDAQDTLMSLDLRTLMALIALVSVAWSLVSALGVLAGGDEQKVHRV